MSKVVIAREKNRADMAANELILNYICNGSQLFIMFYDTFFVVRVYFFFFFFCVCY